MVSLLAFLSIFAPSEDFQPWLPALHVNSNKVRIDISSEGAAGVLMDPLTAQLQEH